MRVSVEQAFHRWQEQSGIRSQAHAWWCPQAPGDWEELQASVTAMMWRLEDNFLARGFNALLTQC
jgi:hypothetical protein